MMSPYQKTPITPRNYAPLKKGLFKDGVWCCNCPQRPPAIKRQTKNGGRNHGRWCMLLLPHLNLTSTYKISLYLPATRVSTLRVFPVGRRRRATRERHDSSEFQVGN